MTRRYFGTDGIRGRVGEYPINAEFVLKLGWAAGKALGREGGRFVIGKDTRISGYMFESALQAGLSASGNDIFLLGPMPTPAVAYLTRTLHADAGIVISASHNPYYDNGIKFFSAKGSKLPDEDEERIEELLTRSLETVDSARLGKATRVNDAGGRYIEFCKSTIPQRVSLKGLHIVVDCANGATYHVAPSVFTELGARVTAIGVAPDGLNINEGCGSTHPKALQAAVREVGADLGIALDGDGDRVIMVDERGELVDGDEILFIIARFWREKGRLEGPVVGTVMSNLGLERALGKLGIPFERAKVGDRYVLERLQCVGGVLGGESSGHILCLDSTTTGDGIVSALQVLHAMLEAGQPLSALRAGMRKYPQKLVNVPFPKEHRLEELPKVQELAEAAQKALADKGRVLLRPSGTEPLLRIMVEGEDARLVEETVTRLAREISDEILSFG